jgi:diaminopimelate epimerase
VPYADLKSADENQLRELGRKLRWHPAFPKGANVNFYEILGPDHVFERTFERGVEDFTYACGTGTGSVVTVLTLLGKVSGDHVQADMTGGSLFVDVERTDDKITDLYLTGPTNIVCKGEVTDEDLHLTI